jgi:hypothetical protein
MQRVGFLPVMLRVDRAKGIEFSLVGILWAIVHIKSREWHSEVNSQNIYRIFLQEEDERRDIL